ncbi:hypothetical protein GA0061102_103533 [Rhizobium miluonense]|uniref:Uncharacterized protein n=1 Tax=Rhizobium miluonense TaxID=411945 RepID=A0A1C3WP36_9HYPH|nr:hypothetical protein GA0061102_103533 [Rhizobium miluonense]
MKVSALKPAADPGSGSLRLLATFDLELSDQIRLYGLRLLQAPDGRRIVYAAQSGSRRTATFDPLLAERITQLASQTYSEATTAHGSNSKS